MSSTDRPEGPKRHITAYVSVLRPHQWLKNALVFVPMTAAHAFSAETFGRSAIAFVAFNLVASSAYVVNDLLDLAADRSHTRKRQRPFASGALPIAQGPWLAAILSLFGGLVAAAIDTRFLAVMLAYFAVTTAYSLGFKRLIIVDICVLAVLYTARILAGGIATGITLSVWLLAFSMFFFFSLAAVKRYTELVDSVAAGMIRSNGRGYHVDDLPVIGAMALASGYVSVLVMALYINSPDVSELYGRPSVLLGICLVLLYWVTRMVLVSHRGEMHDDPIVYAIRDPASLVCLVIMAAFGAAAVVL